MRLKGNPAAVGLRAEMGLSPLQIRRRGRKLGYWRKLCMAHESRLVSLIFRERHAEVVAGTATQSCLVGFKRVLEMHGFAELWTERAVTDTWQADVWHAVDIERSQDETVVMSHHSSLAGYAQLGHTSNKGIPCYLHDLSNREGETDDQVSSGISDGECCAPDGMAGVRRAVCALRH